MTVKICKGSHHTADVVCNIQEGKVRLGNHKEGNIIYNWLGDIPVPIIMIMLIDEGII